jgi:hypothetical protein
VRPSHAPNPAEAIKAAWRSEPRRGCRRDLPHIAPLFLRPLFLKLPHILM